MYNMGALLIGSGKYDEAEPFCRQALEGYRRVGGDDHIGTLYSLSLVGRLLMMQDKPAEAQTQFEEAVERRRRINSETHPQTLDAISGLADALEAQDRWTDAELWRRSVQQVLLNTEPVNSTGLADASCALGRNLLRQNKASEAEVPLTDCLSMYKRSDSADDWNRWSAQSLLGEALAADSTRYAQAEALLLESIDRMKAIAPNSGKRESQRITETASRLAALYDERQEPHESSK